MTNKWNKKTCPLCKEGVLHIGTKIVVQNYKGHSYTSKASGAFCDRCTDGFVEYNETEEAAWQAFRDQVDTQLASELASIRKRLKLTQAQAAQIAGGGKNAFSRYERGQTKPMAAVVNLFKLLDKHPELVKELAA